MIKPLLTTWLEQDPYSLRLADKNRLLAKSLYDLTEWHRAACLEYSKILRVIGYPKKSPQLPEHIPFIPARLFKEIELSSVKKAQVFKTLTSSGTTGQNVSRIYLDRDTAGLQSRILVKIMVDILGKKRLPMLVIDSVNVLKDRQTFSARGAGILGFSIFGQDVTYALDENMNLDLLGIEKFLQRHCGKKIFLFGFTFMIWQHFCLSLKEKGIKLPIDRGILLHGGGWKKLESLAISKDNFSKALGRCTGIKRVVNYYGMVEQTGSIYIECEAGHLHAPVYSDIVVRCPKDFSPVPIGQEGLIEVLSLIPLSYPGHALLTEDLGRIDGVDDCQCGRLGKYFTILGRVAKAEVRGCSDTYETNT